MKIKELNSILTKLGFWIVRSNKHTVWFNGTTTVILPQHKEVGKYIAKDTLKLVKYQENVQSIGYKAA